ncbi:ABC transporter ATP-binding protein [Solirubrobacter soli]|uniref:ABC transporter ATP-binding protein n=1 Tax=Solirubrobacter soli TaxID=363832 RepID=UPI000423310D|nr:sn-glycerol-3-phosphate ABC transporter ATP-binding protein UgpC [Solirubrobacter soli]
MAEITFENVWKRYPDGFEAVKDMSLQITDGEFMILVGPSGCGKSTALRMVAGLEDITDGELVIGGERVNELAPRDRDIAMVFQNYALYPHMTVRENMGFALKLAKVNKSEIDKKVDEAAEILELGSHLDRKPANLSGGQRQRVAMGRAIVRDPKAFLMDEPLSNLDAKLRVQMRTQVARIQQQLGTTMLYVTHDQTEAMTLGDRVAVMRAGIIQQVDTPKVLYEDPINLFVAGFIGSPAMNFIPARLEENKVRLPFGDAPIPAGVTTDKREVIAGIRPEHLEDAAYGDDIVDGLRFTTTVDVLESMGSELYAYFDIKGTEEVHNQQLDELAADAGLDDVPGGGATHMVARLDARSNADHGRDIELILDASQIMLFDPDGGRSLTTAH